MSIKFQKKRLSFPLTFSTVAIMNCNSADEPEQDLDMSNNQYPNSASQVYQPYLLSHTILSSLFRMFITQNNCVLDIKWCIFR